MPHTQFSAFHSLLDRLRSDRNSAGDFFFITVVIPGRQNFSKSRAELYIEL